MGDLIPQNTLDKIPNLYDTEDIKDPLCQVKLFTPDSNWTWYIIEFFKFDRDTCYGYVQGLESELGYFTLSELEKVHGLLGLAVERDLQFETTQLSTIKKKEYANGGILDESYSNT
jgi:hypothetical protein